jgi:hypothetical protein
MPRHRLGFEVLAIETAQRACSAWATLTHALLKRVVQMRAVTRGALLATRRMVHAPCARDRAAAVDLPEELVSRILDEACVLELDCWQFTTSRTIFGGVLRPDSDYRKQDRWCKRCVWITVLGHLGPNHVLTSNGVVRLRSRVH